MKIYCFLLTLSCLTLNANDGDISIINHDSIKVPIPYNKLGNELRSLQNSCKNYTDNSLISIETQDKCSDYSQKVTEAFIIGNKADLSNLKNNDEVKNYLFALRKLDKNYKIVRQAIYQEITEARNKEDILLFTKLIEDEKIELNQIDYEFMNKHKEKFSQNQRYIAYIKSKDIEVIYSDNNQKYSNPKAISKNPSSISQAPTTYSQNSKLQKIDLVTMSAYYSANNNTLSISLFFKNKETDTFIDWKNENVIVNCSAYENRGGYIDISKGALLGQVRNKTLTNAFQTIYITLPSSRYERGIAECSLNINGKQFNNQESFAISNPSLIDSLKKNTYSVETKRK